MRASFRLPISSICATLFVTSSISAFAQSADVPLWTPNLRLASQLAPERSLSTFQWSPPSGYRWGFPVYGLVHFNDPILNSSLRPDKTCAVLCIVSGDTPSTTSMAPDSLAALTQKLAQIDKRKLIVSPIQRGKVSSMSAMRERYQYELPSGVIMHGFLYVLQGKNGCFTADASDSEPYCNTTLPLLETSILTVHEAQNISAMHSGAPSPTKP